MKGRVTYEYMKCVSAKGTSIMDFRFEVDFLLMGHGCLNEFVFSRSLASYQGCIPCGADSRSFVPVQRTVTSAI